MEGENIKELVNCKSHIPIGFRFMPTMAEIFSYLIKKVSSEFITPGIIHDFDVYNCQPSALPGLEKDEVVQFAYYFTPRAKVINATNQKRTTKDGKGGWRSSAKPISYPEGIKNTLAYYLRTKGDKGKGQKTNWIMHEFVLHNSKVPVNANPVEFTMLARTKNISTLNYGVLNVDNYFVLNRICKRRESRQNHVAVKETEIHNSDVSHEAKAEPAAHTLRRKPPMVQPPNMGLIQFSSNHPYNQQLDPQQTRARCCDMVAIAPTGIGASSHSYQMNQGNQPQEVIGHTSYQLDPWFFVCYKKLQRERLSKQMAIGYYPSVSGSSSSIESILVLPPPLESDGNNNMGGQQFRNNIATRRGGASIMPPMQPPMFPKRDNAP